LHHVQLSHNGLKCHFPCFFAIIGENLAEELYLRACNCGVQKNCDCEISLAEKLFLKSRGIAIGEGLSSNCRIALLTTKMLQVLSIAQ
jgi:hypothetical protein